ncbi:MAG: DUF1501 domain-containing protein [Acidimicrobiales bacterium]
MGGLGASAAALATTGYLRSSSGPRPSGSLGRPLPTGGRSTPTAVPSGRVLPGAVVDRVLVVIDFRGGNDGLSLLAPVADGRYHDLRPSLAIAEEDALWLDDEVGLHPAMARLRERPLITVEGVGPVAGDLSHFAMTERWERGDAAGSYAPHTGFLGRLTDALDDGSPLVGLSLSGYTNHLTNTRAATLALDGLDDLWFFEPTDWAPAAAFRQGIERFVRTDDAGPVADAYERLLALSTELASRDEEENNWEDPMFSEGGDLGAKLAAAASLITAGVGTRVVYVGYGDFDTHVGHQWKQQDNLQRLDAALDGFLRRIDEAGASDRVLVATVSEFGRRVEEHDGGLDHGSASTMLLAGPLHARQAGERPDLGDLDDDGNLRTTVPFDRYLATLAEEWLGVEAASVLPESATPLGIL